MNMDRRQTNRDITLGSYDEAEHWFVRLLEPDCPAEQREAFERWRAADPEHAAAYREIQLLWKQSEDAIKDPAVMAAAKRALQPEPQVRARKRWFVPALAAGFAALLLAVALPRWLGAPADPAGTAYATVAGQEQTVTLADGSSILLDTDTKVVVRYSERTRRVDLLRGQAQFSVQGNHAWPFVVHAGAGTVTAVGTQFQVRLDDEVTDVALLKGKLAIAAQAPNGGTQDASLVGGQGLSYDANGQITPIHAVDMQQAHGWTSGQLFVHNWRLADLIAEMNRYSNTKLQLGDASLANIRVSGVFRTSDQQTLLLLLQQGWSIRAQRINGTQIQLLR
ncbi:FecR family protein [Dyella caseinilytica]|uniref:FecR family protein n=1 Tax=Dyella caseinilytica TaxID=1849581 RepID=A0ABX7GTA7_9GAMM|nr:FecR family protein [Dyella caseinilytica]QRN53642.1 FecR family protein [Dyella caseinilytica]GFZ88153.1 sensor [Dyella caseinilytica]